MANKFMGASLYVPANHKNLLAIANGELLPNARSLIFCTEDAVSEEALGYALFNLQLTLENMHPSCRTDRFVRVRNTDVLKRVLAMHGSEKLTGFVIPKASAENFHDYFDMLRDTKHLLMPTLETAEVFCDDAMRDLRSILLAPEVKPRILALRIGGNDLLALLGLRRPRSVSIYQTPLGSVIAKLVIIFKPHGFELTAPVFEYLDLPELLDQEVIQDLAHGLVGKTAIHPDQIEEIECHYRVSNSDMESASAILNVNSPAVFKMHNAMCEIATHKAWAIRTLERSELFGQHSHEASRPVNEEQNASY